MNNAKNIALTRFNREEITDIEDILAIEEPLEITIGYGTAAQRTHKTISVTMRTPDHDFELALGFLYTEGVIFSKNDIANVRYLDDNRVLVDLHENALFDVEKLNRHFYTTSSCGVCGKAALDAVVTQTCVMIPKDFPKINAPTLLSLSSQLFDNQSLFSKTGGTHASVLFNTEGVVQKTFEDVGRHNALDKLIGWTFQQNLLPLKTHILLVSGRASFELIQKAAMAGIPIVVAIGAPSSLAVDVAEAHNITLVGFLKENSFNVYTGIERIL
jgi:FdhD protein